MVIQFKVPAKVNVPLPAGYSGEQLVAEIVSYGLSHSGKVINKALSKLREPAKVKLETAAAELDVSVEQYLQMYLVLLSSTYLSCKTNLVSVSDIETGKKMPAGAISVTLTKLADIMGEKVMGHIFRELTYHMDEAIDKRIGQGIA